MSLDGDNVRQVLNKNLGFIPPFLSDRGSAREIIGEDNFFEIPNFTGISNEYGPPVNPALIIDTDQCLVAEAADMVMGLLFLRVDNNKLI